MGAAEADIVSNPVSFWLRFRISVNYDMNELETFLQRHEPQDEEITAWGDGQFPLRITCYFSEELPPLALVTSVRAIVFAGEQLLALRNTAEWHIFPGGRREAGEQLHETLQREILEETG